MNSHYPDMTYAMLTLQCEFLYADMICIPVSMVSIFAGTILDYKKLRGPY